MGSGTVRAVSIAGLSYNIMGEASFSSPMSVWEVSRTPGSGTSMKKMVKRVPVVESVDLMLDGSDRENLRLTAEGIPDVTLSYETLEGDLYSATGSVNIESWTTDDNKVTVQLQPADGWTASVNS